jgi:hypothetical protein
MRTARRSYSARRPKGKAGTIGPPVDPIFAAIEANAFSIWLRESSSLWVFPFILILHTVGLAFLVGANLVLDLRLLGWATGVPVTSLRRYVWVMWLGFWTNAFSGVLLLIAYPTKALTNPLFYAKLALIAAALLTARRVWRVVSEAAARGGGDLDRNVPDRLRALAVTSLACWVAAIPAGRFLAYTCTRLMVDGPC